MTRAPLVQLAGISLTWGGHPLFDGLDLAIQPGDRIALVGRNGSGKSTLMRLLAGQVQPDSGTRTQASGTRIGLMEQEPELAGFATLGDYAAGGLAPGQDYRVAAAVAGLDFDPATPVATASGGERRRAALARLLAEAPDLLLMDEPTNHLDIAAVEWLESQLRESGAALVLVSHDRAFLRALARAVLWLDRGQVRRLDRGFDAFEDWRDSVWAAEDEARHKLDRRIEAEAKWAVEGISARRRRNQGRLRALAGLRAERAAQVRRQGTAGLALDQGRVSGRLVIEAKGISKAFGGRTVFRPFDLTILRGDRVAVVGPNGAGKTTLLRVLTGALAPDTGTVRHGTGLELAQLDQDRGELDPGTSLREALVGGPGMTVAGRADQVMVRGRPRHVLAYLKDFLFDEARARAPVGSLSGGERARLLLARIMARPSNLLVLDEPTNDLDVETLDLLQEVLGEYEGTVLLVSHDRDFIDRIATMTLAFEDGGRVTAYPGGWSDHVAQRPAGPAAAELRRARPAAAPAPAPARPQRPPAAGLTFTERHRLAALPELIARLEGEIAALSAFLSDAEVHVKAPDKARRAAAGLAERQAALDAAEAEWLTLEEKAAGG
ncbi:MAG: ATP-binding cassette domain-containing protein [Rhodobacteraceae bacterium]|nr:ATP-binding cassette domain-containing protein [Paracoccaceae bacterium]